MNPSNTLREIAAIATNPRIKELAAQLAAELELQPNRQNNAFQATLGNAELGWANRLDAIVARLDTSDERQQTILEMLETLQQELRALQGKADAGA